MNDLKRSTEQVTASMLCAHFSEAPSVLAAMRAGEPSDHFEVTGPAEAWGFVVANPTDQPRVAELLRVPGSVVCVVQMIGPAVLLDSMLYPTIGSWLSVPVGIVVPPGERLRLCGLPGVILT